jgi:hypothetical protein
MALSNAFGEGSIMKKKASRAQGHTKEQAAKNRFMEV